MLNSLPHREMICGYGEILKHSLISDRKFGLFLSGGTDSTALVLYAKEILKKNFDVFTYDFHNYDNGESVKSEKIAKSLNLKFMRPV